ncbi:MAG: 2-dehydropantoate 2-reductase, partial [Candidatus Thermoplasmatota archaeon]
VRHAGVGDTVIGGFSGVDENDVVRVRDVFEDSGIHTTISPNIRRDLWLKVIVNAGINPLAALTGLRNGQLVVVPPLREAMTELCAEAAAVARAEGFELSNREAINLTVRVARRTRENKASMLQDVERHRRTEIDAITGAILRAADRHGLKVPTNRLAYALVHGLERSYRPSTS